MIGRLSRAIAVTVTLMLAAAAAPAGAVVLPDDFQDSVAFDGLQEPTSFRFSPDGRVFVAEKSGRILVFDDLEDEDPTQFADLAKQVYDNGDRGILGLALDPGFPAQPYVYVLYTFDHVFGEDESGGEDLPGDFPHWGVPGNGYVGDPCPKPADADVDACPVGGRLVRLTAEGNHAAEEAGAAAEHVLVEGWCQQSSSHSIGDLEFGPEGALFASGGEGASFSTPDYGQLGWPHKNQCGDPPGPVGTALEPPDAEGGSLRSQDVLTPGDPTGLSGTVIRIDPETGEGLPGNPFATSLDANARRIVAFGLRNPFRFAINATTDEVYVNNVGGGPYEEIDRFATIPSPAYNSGWPCFEATDPNLNFQSLELDLCESLYEQPGSTSAPFFYYRRPAGIAGAPGCPTGNGSAISGSTFYDGDSFPSSYDDAFFFADSVFGCIFVMFPDADGRPDPSTVVPFLTEGGVYPGLDIHVGLDGDLYYVSMFNESFEQESGTIHRVSYFPGNQPPVARLTATPRSGASPLQPQFDATGSTDADGEPLSYEWDFENDGSFEAATSVGTMTRTFSDSANHTIAVRVRDQQGAGSVARVTVFPGDTPPQPQIVAPLEVPSGSGETSLTWGVGQRIDFEGAADDAEDGDLAATSLDWSSRLYHCPGGVSGCHAHPLQAFPTVAEGHLIAPDHDYPSRIELRLTATDSRGLSATRAITVYPRAVDLMIASEPPGLSLTAGFVSKPGPFTLTAIEGSILTLSAPENAELGGKDYTWEEWSDGGGRVHTIVVGSAAAEYTASYWTDPGPDDEEPPVGENPPGEKERAPAGGGGSPPPVQQPGIDLAPQTWFTSHPPRRSERKRAQFLFAGDDPAARFRCRLDQGPRRSCRSPRIYTGLSVGRHVFRVAAVDAGGLADPTPAIFRWRVLG